MADLIIWNSLSLAIPGVNRMISGHHLASWLSDFGYDTKVIDFCSQMTTEQLCDITEKYITKDTIAIGASSTFWKIDDERLRTPYEEPEWLVSSRKILQERYPKIDWIMGGGNVYGNVFQFKWRKFISFAEDSLLKYLDDNTNKKVLRPLFNIQKVKSAYLTKGMGLSPHEVVPLEISRGCQFKCSYCSYPLLGKKKGTYTRDMKLVEDEIRRIHDEFGTTHFWLTDDTVNESEEKIIQLADIVNRLPFKFQWVGYNRIDLIERRPYTIQLLKETGLKSTFFGIETFHPKASLAIGKGWNGKNAKDFLIKLKEEWAGEINMHLNFIVGLPGETEKDIDETHQWLKDNKMDAWYFDGLRIRGDIDHTPWISKFEKDYALYGYKKQDPSSNWWENEYWNTTSALQKAIRLTDDSKLNHNQICTPDLCGFVFTGQTFSDLIVQYERNIDFKYYDVKRKEFVNDYVNYQLSQGGF